VGVADVSFSLAAIDDFLQRNASGVVDGTIVYVTENATTLMIGASVAGVSVVDGSQVSATECSDDTIRDAALQLQARAPVESGTVMLHNGNYIQKTMYTDSHGLALSVVVVQPVSCQPNYYQPSNITGSVAQCEKCPYPYSSYGGAASECTVW
jgi:hypothetical protein